MKTSLIGKRIITVLALCILMISCSAHTGSNSRDGFKFPVSSFTKIEAEARYKPIKCTPPDGKPDCSAILSTLPVAKSTSVGSGAIISTQNNGTYILTAAHVCRENATQEFVMPNGYKITASVEVGLYAIDWLGVKRSAVEIAADVKNDVCIIKTQPGWGEALKIATTMPSLGDAVYNMAAPFGIFGPKMVLLFEGYYSGKDYRNVYFFTVPTRPGSSGSPILNSKGEVISVIHSAMIRFESVGLGCDLTAIQNLVQQIPPDKPKVELVVEEPDYFFPL